MTIRKDDVLEWLQVFAAEVEAQSHHLTALDAAIGDGDHGANMARGFQAVRGKLPEFADKDIGTVLKTVGMTLVSTVGGASGPLYGTLFMQMGNAVGHKAELSAADWAAALESGVEGVINRGKAGPGDKTMVDALVPALQALKQSLAAGGSFSAGIEAAASACREGMLATIPMVARKGRASYLGQRSAGHQDPGATSACLLFQTAARTWSGQRA
jgi:dihydroxyacetone kinase-like protein